MHPARIAEALGLARPTGELTLLTHQSSQTWTLATTDGRILLKHTPHTPPAAITFETRARQAGIAMPTPITDGPAHLTGLGPVRAYAWLDHRPLRPDDNIAAWLGRTLALLHAINPGDQGGPDWYRMHDDRWHTWLGTGGERRWKPTAGPVLIDSDSAGPDSARLETAHAIYALATHGRTAPDTTVINQAVHAYTRNGGTPPAGPGTPPAGPGILARRLGIRLGRLAERLRISLGEQPARPRDLDANDDRAEAQIRSIPAFTRQLRTDAALFRPA